VKRLSLISCLICLLIPGSAALSQPFPSFMLDSTIGHVPPFADIGFTRVAFGPEVGLATWGEDDRLLAARIDGQGLLLDTIPIDMGGSAGRTGVAWGGGGFLVAWTKQVFLTPDRAECALVDTSGKVVWRQVLQDSVKQGMSAAAAFDGTNFLVAWIARNEADTFTVYFSRISPQGVVLDSPPRIAAPHAQIEQYDIALCFHEDRYLAVWNHYDTGGLWASWILPDGTVPDSVGFPIRAGTATEYPAVTHDRNNFVVSWNERPYLTKVARVTDGGQVLDTSGVTIDTNSLWESDICSIGDTTLVVYFSDSLWGGDSLRPMAVRVDTALQILGAPVALAWPSDGHVYGNGPTALSVAAAGDSFIATWAQPARDISVQATCLAWFRRLNQQGQILDTAPVPMSYGVNTQQLPDVASDGTDFLAVWVDLRYDSADLTQSLVGRRFSADGDLLDSQPFQVGGTHAWRPALAFGGGCYLAVWYEDHEVHAARISASGILLDSLPIRLVDPDGHWPFQDVAYGDSLFLVVWPTLSPQRVHGARITPSGVVLDSVPLLLQVDTLTSSSYPQIAFDGTNFLVARNDAWPDPDEFRCVRVSAAGQLLDTTDMFVTTSGDASDRLDLAFGGNVYGTADSRRGYFWRVSPDGSVLGRVPHSYQGPTQVVYDGADFMLLTEMRDSSSQLTNKLGALRITPEGRVLDTRPFVLLTADSATVGVDDAAMTANGAGRVAVVVESYEPRPYGVYRIRAAAFPAVVGIGSQPSAAPPVAFRLHPNPASRLASLSFNLTQAGLVRVTAFDAAGRRCASLFSGRMKAGMQTLPLDTRRLANGVYFLRLEAGAATRSARLVVSH
jgi:hypothetical protein